MLKKKQLVDFWRVYKQRKTAVFGLAIVVVFAVVLILAPQIAPYDPHLKVGAVYETPSWAHLLGTNDVGYDILSELIFAGRISVMVGLIAAGAAMLLGTVVGLVSGFLGRVVDEVLMRITDVIIALPRLPLMIVMAAYLGPGMWTIVLVYSAVGWPSIARQVRSQVLSVREFTFVEASKAIGGGNIHIMASHILPNVMGIIIANTVLEIVFAILTESGLSFLGLGDPIHASWGVMLHFAQIQGAFFRGIWWWIAAPGLCIVVITSAFYFIGTALNDLFGLKLGKR